MEKDFKEPPSKYTGDGISPKKEGSQLHQERAKELESDDESDIKVPLTEVDELVRRTMKLYNTLVNLPEKKIRREVNIYGRIKDILIVGRIDELRYDDETEKIIISELKTRRTEKPVKPAQLRRDRLQCMLYYKLLTNIQKIDIEALCTTLQLDSKATFSAETLKRCPEGVTNITELLTLLKSLPKVDVLSLELRYILQRDKSEIATVSVLYNEEELSSKVANFEEYWLGAANPRGIDKDDIEELWKCGWCRHKNQCDYIKDYIKQVNEYISSSEEELSSESDSD